MKTEKEIQEAAKEWNQNEYGIRVTNKHAFIAGAKWMQDQDNWISVNNQLPPIDKEVMFRGVIEWKSKDSVSYFSDKMLNDGEILDYGAFGYLLENHNDYLVTQYPFKSEVCSEYITHWSYINPPKAK